ncbi:hypothetical protein F4604DRAFT_1672748 [Suillus subluteus]|nr:hypothetical protein F4604DRAFT_1672748 [Suillus subluteus]
MNEKDDSLQSITQTCEKNLDQYTYLQAGNSNYDHQKVDQRLFLKALWNQDLLNFAFTDASQSQPSSHRIHSDRRVERNANQPKSRLYSHSVMIRDSSRHITIVQKDNDTLRRSQPGWADMKYLKMLNQYNAMDVRKHEKKSEQRGVGSQVLLWIRVENRPKGIATEKDSSSESDLPLNKMAPFNSSLLALSPTPEPVMRPTSPAKEAGSPVQEVPETEQQKLLHSWVALLQALDTQVKIIPGDGPELFEDRETWMRGWSQLSVQLTESATIAERLKMELEFDDVGRTILEEGKCAYRIFSKEIREIKERAVVDPPPRTPLHPKRLLQKMVAEVILPGSKGSGGKLVESGKPKKAGAPRKAGSAPNMSLPAGSVPGSVRHPASSVAKDDMDVDSSGSGESEVEEKEVPIRAIKALPSCTVKADKGKGKGSVPSIPTDGADEVESEVERLRAENEHLKNIIHSMRQSGRSQQSRLIALSNQTYTMSTELARLDDELAFLN